MHLLHLGDSLSKLALQQTCYRNVFQNFPTFHSYSIESVYYTRTFITTIVIGNDMVPR